MSNDEWEGLTPRPPRGSVMEPLKKGERLSPKDRAAVDRVVGSAYGEPGEAVETWRYTVDERGARIERLLRQLRNSAFAEGVEEREGGSARRQEKHSERSEQIHREIMMALASPTPAIAPSEPRPLADLAFKGWRILMEIIAWDGKPFDMAVLQVGTKEEAVEEWPRAVRRFLRLSEPTTNANAPSEPSQADVPREEDDRDAWFVVRTMVNLCENGYAEAAANAGRAALRARTQPQEQGER